VGTERVYPARMAAVEIRDELPSEREAVVSVIAAAFTAEPEVAGLWEDLREVPGTVSLVAEFAGEPVGHVGLSVGWVDAKDRVVTVRILSPLSVHPAHQRQGIGRGLVAAARARADELGAPALFLEGDPAYYSRLGFEPGRSHGFTPPSVRIPGPGFQVMLLTAYEPTITGALVYPDVFWRHGAVGLRGDDLERFSTQSDA
jgi:putative acetyltransferase